MKFILSNLETVFNAAAATGHKTPTLRANGLRFKRAPDSGRNAGSIYVTEGPTYIGKIYTNSFWPVWGLKVSTELLIAISAIMDNPEEEAIKYGRRTGNCAICGRHLDNAQSVALGIGPICAEKFGWLDAAAEDISEADLADLI